MKERRLGSWWFETGTPDLLVRRMRTWELEPAELADCTIEAEEERLRDVRCDDPDPVPLLFQTGCLTIRGRDAEGVFELGVRYGDVERGLVR